MQRRERTILAGEPLASSLYAVAAGPRMVDPASNPELLRSLGRLVRGLSSLFWGLPISLLVCFYTYNASLLKPYAAVVPMAATGLLVYGLWQLRDFQKQERVWQAALDRAMILSMIDFGLSPFLFMWNRVQDSVFFTIVIIALAVSGLLFLASLNIVLQRLGAMLPDEALRHEIKQFTGVNLNLLIGTFVLMLLYIVVGRFHQLPLWMGFVASLIEGLMERGSAWFLVLLILLPLAMTMALIWKTKEVILENVFGTTR
jgi:hypothetical protein